MNSQLIVHHPYRTLLALQGTFSLSQDESSLAWSIINDHYMTDLPLLYPPHVIAITSILLALVLRPLTNGGPPTSGPAANSIATAAQAALNSANQAKNGSPAEKVVRPAVTKVQKLSNWLAETNMDIEGMIDCTQEIISFYDAQEHYNEKTTREQINRFVKARGLDR
jgi:cyclin-C